MKLFKILLIFIAYAFFFGVSSSAIVLTGTVLYLSPNLPSVEKIREIQLQIPLRIFTNDGKLISEFGEKRRTPVEFQEIPANLTKAILAAEDDRFYQHHGVDIKSLLRASVELIRTGSIKTGGSTITMQVAKNFFLSSERTFLRKFNEILLAIQIERELSKEEIFELYANKIYLGHRSYGVAAAAKVYYGQEIQRLNLAQQAMIAGLPKAPSRYNPITNPQRAMIRRNWILERMLALNYIDPLEYKNAIKQPVTAQLYASRPEIEANYVAEMVRSKVIKMYGNKVYTDGFNVYTSLDSHLQQAATKALQDGLIAYSERHGYHGATKFLAPEEVQHKEEDGTYVWRNKLKTASQVGPLHPAIILKIDPAKGEWALAGLKDGSQVRIYLQNMEWARTYFSVNARGKKPSSVKDIFSTGDLVQLIKVFAAPDTDIKKNSGDSDSVNSDIAINEKNKEDQISWRLSQLPKAQAALVSLKPQDGAILALAGGFDFYDSKFNRVTQGGRQAGSSFKPFVYSAALEKGFTPSTLINDAPIVFEDRSLEQAWRPENSSGKFFGPTRLRKALYKSRNLVSIRLLKQMGIPYAAGYAARFGFPKSSLPKNLSLALGSATLTPLQVATGYATLANGGYKVEPYFINHIQDSEGNIIFQQEAAIACDENCATLTAQGNLMAPRIMDKRAHFLIQDMLKDVIKRGTGRKALTLKRNDIAGKTGTTNDQRDAWFSGFHPDIVATTWVGFDTPATLGAREYGGTAALPIWIDYMREALKDRKNKYFTLPKEMVSIKIDPDTGRRALPQQNDAIFEYFREENAPQEWSEENPAIPSKLSNENRTLEALF